MSKLTRRSVLQGMSLLSIGSFSGSFLSCKTNSSEDQGLTPKAGIADKNPRVNVVLHGMFAMMFDYRNVAASPYPLTVLVPEIDMHAYGAGAWKKEKQMMKGSTYQLQGLKSNPSFDIAGTQFATDALIKASGPLTYGTQPYCILQLPFPDSIVSLRVLKSGASPFRNSGTYGSQLQTTRTLPLIYVLGYENFNGGTTQLIDPINHNPLWQSDGSPVSKVHVFSDPVFDDVSSAHLQSALDGLNALFTPNLQITFDTTNTDLGNDVAIDASSGHSSIDRCEEATVFEDRQGLCTPGSKGGKPRNCMALLIKIPQ